MVLAVASSGRNGMYGLGRRTNLRPGSACCKHSVRHRALAEARGWGEGKGMGGRAGVHVEMGRAERVTHARRCREG